MPCDYSKYPPNWKTEIRPAILKRAGNKCEFCGIANGITILRGTWCDREVYQDDDGWIYDAETSDKIGGDYLGEVDRKQKNKFVTIVLTVMHLNHDTTDNRPENLKAACQLHHNRHDKEYRQKNASITRAKKTGQIKLF